jgi:hypothetical protein
LSIIIIKYGENIREYASKLDLTATMIRHMDSIKRALKYQIEYNRTNQAIYGASDSVLEI